MNFFELPFAYQYAIIAAILAVVASFLFYKMTKE